MHHFLKHPIFRGYSLVFRGGSIFSIFFLPLEGPAILLFRFWGALGLGETLDDEEGS